MDSHQPNPPRTTANVWWAITILSLLSISIPWIFDIKMNSGGVIIVIGCAFLALIGLIIASLYMIRAKKLNRIFQGDKLMAHWTYSSDEWQQYAEVEYQRQKDSNRKLFMMVSIVAIVCVLGFWIFNNSSGAIAFFAVLGVIALIGFISWFVTYYNYKQNKNIHGQVYLTSDAVYINRQLHDLKGFGSKLEKTELKEDLQPYIEFTYSVPTRHGRQNQEVRVPIPQGKYDEALKLVEKYNTL